ncbi:hypothetical protein ACFPK1_22655 [Actinomycetospora rhizophila]|uniref:DUF4239 domain-containing protein n=1 Tax=Actinomycetospora rhizophila TaxID=1416876 RepID=A0ABV9ZKW2_9PSEU
MIAWPGHAPLPVLVLVVFAAVYLGAALVLAGLWLARRSGHGESLGPLSPGLLSPLGLIFGLLVGFLVADVWADRDDAAAAVSREASALRDVDLLMGAFPAQHREVQRLLAEQIDQYVTDEWPEMADGDATLTVAPARLVAVQAAVLSLPVQTEGQRVAQDRLVTAVDQALESRRTRLVLSGSAIDPLRLTALYLVALTTLAAMGCIHADRLRRAGVSLALLATAMALALTLLCAQAAPFAGYFAIDPDLLLQVRPT